MFLYISQNYYVFRHFTYTYECVHDHKSEIIKYWAEYHRDLSWGLYCLIFLWMIYLMLSNIQLLWCMQMKLYRRVITLQDIQLPKVDINNLTKWSMKWNMRFNPLKWKFLNVNPKRISIDEHNYLINDHMINHVRIWIRIRLFRNYILYMVLVYTCMLKYSWKPVL